MRVASYASLTGKKVTVEVVEGLNPGDAVITAMISGDGSFASSPSRPPNPFGGGMRRF